jgi:hypothetical protein
LSSNCVTYFQSRKNEWGKKVVCRPNTGYNINIIALKMCNKVTTWLYSTILEPLFSKINNAFLKVEETSLLSIKAKVLYNSIINNYNNNCTEKIRARFIVTCPWSLPSLTFL